MNNNEMQLDELIKDLKSLSAKGLLSDSVDPFEAINALSPEAKKEWDALLESCEPSPAAKAAGLTNIDILYHVLERAQIVAGAASDEEAKERLSVYDQIRLLGTGRDIDRYDTTPRKVRCISRGYRFDRSEEWEMTLNTANSIEDMLKRDGLPLPDQRVNGALEVLLEEPEAENLVIGETYTLITTFPDIPLQDGKSSHVGLVFLEEIHSAPKDYIDYPDGGFHSRLFEEMDEVSIDDRIRHHDEYITMDSDE